ncbi:MAG: NAD-dependent epimerase/dehydratase family protein [Candidatus Hydrogenedentes bacterium]|nr:NAD-dependent epimerase/dehydratase family protein [Candidatus Hydrogenedentota bacterium]
MSTTLVTGGTGLVGYNVIRALQRRGRTVRALVRNRERGELLLPEGCLIAEGDVTLPDTLESAVEGCDSVYHCAGLPEQWLKQPQRFHEVNVGGTRNVLDAAARAKVKTVVYTSTIDVFKAAQGAAYDESVIDDRPKGTHYERSKQEADRVAVDFLGRGLDVRFLHPSGVFGPGPAGSPGINQLIVDLSKGQLPMLLPGGFPVVYSEDVGEGHVLAEEKGVPGGRYILSDIYFTLTEISGLIVKALNKKSVPPVMPLWMGEVIATAGEGWSRISGKAPLIPRGQLHFLQWQARPRADRACAELGWTRLPLKEALTRTIQYLNETGAL